LLTIVQKIKKNLNREIIFLVDVVLKQNKVKTSITFKIQNAINILKFFVIFDNNRFTRFLTLFKQRIDSNVTNKSSIKDKINFYKYK